VLRRGLATAALLWLGLTGSTAWAQVSIEVVVLEDGSYEPVAGLRVDLQNLDTATTRTGITDALGAVRFLSVETGGVWVARTEATDTYASQRSQSLRLRSGFDPTITLLVRRSDGTPAPGEVERVEIRGDSGQARLNQTNAEVSHTLTAGELSRIPIESLDLERALFRLPFVTRGTGFFPEAPTVAINGANNLFTNYMIDGLDNNENFLGGMRFPVPIGVVQDVTVLANSYSVEYGRTANGVVNVTTRSGTNQWFGELFFVTRPGLTSDLNTDFPQTDLQGNPVNPDFQRYQVAAAVGGPIVKDKTFIFAHAQYNLDLLDNQLVSPGLGVDEVLRGDNETVLFTTRLDHVWNRRWRSDLRINHGRVYNELPGGGVQGGVTFPSAGTQQERFSTNVALTTSYRADQWAYTGALQYSRFDWDYRRPINGPGPQTTLIDPDGQPAAILGHPGFIFDEAENTFQTQHKIEIDREDQRFKFGTQIIVADFDLVGGGNVDGNRTVQLVDEDLEAVRALGRGSALTPADVEGIGTLTSNVFETREASLGTNQQLYGLFIEDEIRVRSDLTVTLGLRWDYDSLSAANGAASGDFDNLAPRFSFNWSLRPDLVLRGGVGLFYEKIPYAVVSDAIQFSTDTAGFRAQLEELQAQGVLPADADIDDLVSNGNFAVQGIDQETGEALCTGPDDCAARRDELSANELRIQNPEGLDNPFAVQSTVGAQWKFLPDWLGSVDFIYNEGFNLIRLIDLNAAGPFAFNQELFDQIGPEGVAALTPEQREMMGLTRSVAAANATRPTAIRPGGARSIIVSDTGGRSRYLAMNVALYKDRSSDFYDLNFFYTLSRLENDTDDINFRASDANDFDADWGPSLNDRTHILSSIVNLYPFEGLVFTVTALLQSGAPINFVPSAADFGTTDLNGDGLSFADQFTGNPDRFPGTDRNSGRLDWSFNLDLGLQYAFGAFGGEFILRGDVFNVLNLNNESGFPVNFTSSNQIQQGGGAPREQRSADLPRTVQFTLGARI
jgi:outer membrane receptor protein involved in Fe transport